jgi:hypothetical protein
VPHDHAVRYRVASGAALSSQLIKRCPLRFLFGRTEKSYQRIYDCQSRFESFHHKEAWAAKLRSDRDIGDFRTWKNHDEYQQVFERVLRDLTASTQKSG